MYWNHLLGLSIFCVFSCEHPVSYTFAIYTIQLQSKDRHPCTGRGLCIWYSFFCMYKFYLCTQTLCTHIFLTAYTYHSSCFQIHWLGSGRLWLQIKQISQTSPPWYVALFTCSNKAALVMSFVTMPFNQEVISCPSLPKGFLSFAMKGSHSVTPC